ncbi:chorismate mutase [Nanoarchaeota archaeon]
MGGKDIDEVRKHIDRLDTVIITTLAERLSLIPEIAEYKKANNVPIFDEKREVEIMKKLLKIAQENGLDKGFVEEVFLSVLNESKRLQSQIVSKK